MPSAFSACLRIGALAAFIAALSACATLDEDECRTVNWWQLGNDDGQAGRNVSHIDRHRSACDRHGIPVAEDQWRAGWEGGIRQYCTPGNGLAEGRAGRHYANSCPPDISAGFEDAYRVGRAVHDARNEVARLQSELDSMVRQMRRVEDPGELLKLQMEISLMRDRLRRADRRLREAERDYDFFAYRAQPRG
jgi:hypothetical protein